MRIKRRRQGFPCISLAPAFIYPFIYISLCIWYHFCVLSSKYLSSCTNKTDFTVGVWGSTERYIVLLLKYNLWTRNDHRCKFILCTFFFLNKNMYISIWGESSIKMSEPGEYCHTHRRTHTHTHARIHKRATLRDCWRNKLLPMPGETQLSSGKLELGWQGLGWHRVGALAAWGAQCFQTWPFWEGEEGEITPLTRWVFSSPHSSN